MQFVHLHCHTEHSLLDGVGTVSDWVKRAKELNMPALAITDHGNINGVQQLLFSCEEEKIKPIIGCECYIVPDRLVKEKKEYRNHVTLLAKNMIGYQNLIKLTSQGHIDGFYRRPRIDFELLKQYRDGLIVLSGCYAGTVYQALMNNNLDQANMEVDKYCDTFGDDYYIELMLFPNDKFKKLYPNLVNFAVNRNLPLVLTNDCHYIHQKDSLLQDLLVSIKTTMGKNTTKKSYNKKPFRFDVRCLWLKSAEELYKSWQQNYQNCIDKKALYSAMTNTLKIADKVEKYEIDRSNKYPKIYIKDKQLNNDDMNKMLLKRIKNGWNIKGLSMENNSDYYQRMRYEYQIITSKNMSAYFLILEDAINYARNNDIMVGFGRGSVAGCLLAYLLGITQVDPIKHGLLFERFINESSDNMPDIDVDFDARYREDVKQYLINKYGEDKVGEIATYGIMKLKMALKDIAKIYKIDYQLINDITKIIPGDGSDITKDQILNLTGDLRNKEIIIDLALRLRGQIRHMSIHPAGLVIAPDELTKYIPLQRYKNRIVTGWTEGIYRREISGLGLVKYDILGLKTLSYVSDCIKLIKKNHDVEIEVDKIILDDKKVYKNYCKNLVVGVFQCDSSSMRNLMKGLKPNCFNDIIAILAIDRPAYLSLAIHLRFFENRKNKSIREQFHPRVWNVLKETYGTMLYQEQVLELAKDLGGFDSKQRLTMKKLLKKPPTGRAELEVFLKKKEELKSLFIENATDIVGDEQANYLWGCIDAFGLYGFNKSHSCSYALLSYTTMWLKTHYSLEFYTALLNHTNDVEKISGYRKEMNIFGIKLLQADVNKSSDICVTEDGNIRYGLGMIKGIGKSSEFLKDKEYTTFDDFLIDVKDNKRILNRRVVLALIRAGAFDSFCDREQALNAYLSMVDKKHKEVKLNIFQKISGEKDSYGFYFTQSIDKYIAEHIVKRGFMQLNEALNKSVDTTVKLYAVVDNVNITDKGIFINIRDMNKDYAHMRSVIIGWGNKKDQYGGKINKGDIIVAQCMRANYQGKKEFMLRGQSGIKCIGG